MLTHLRQAKNNGNPACQPSGTNRWVFGVSPADFVKAGDKCKKCDVIFGKRKAEQIKKKEKAG